jgi:hypothetical protein
MDKTAPKTLSQALGEESTAEMVGVWFESSPSAQSVFDDCVV